MTPAALADVVTNARAKVAAGNADYLDVAVVALADLASIRRACLIRLIDGAMVYTCVHCGEASPDEPLPDNHWRECEKHPARAEVDAAVALLREAKELVALVGDGGPAHPPAEEWGARAATFLASHPEPAKDDFELPHDASGIESDYGKKKETTDE